MQVVSSEPFITRTIYGDGEQNIDISDNTYYSTSYQVRTSSTSTVFTYGVGYNPTDNLQIDLLGATTTDLEFDGLRLSFTIKL